VAASRVGAHPRKTPTTGPAAAESAAAESVAQARAVPESAAAGRGVAVRPRVCGGWADRAGREVGSPEQCRATRCPRLQNHAAGSPNGGTTAAADGVLRFVRRSGGGHGGAGTTPDLARAETLSHGRATRSPDAEEPHPGLVLQPQHLADGVRAEDHLLRLRSDLAAGPEREQHVGRHAQLGQQFIAAKLNLASGASTTPAVSRTALPEPHYWWELDGPTARRDASSRRRCRTSCAP
jgi:hypothetical protein